MKPPYFLFDIGATHTRLGFSQTGETVENTQIHPTPPRFEEGLSLVVGKAHELSGGQIGAAVGGIAGPLNKEKTMITAAPNLLSWNNMPFSESLSAQINTKVFLENDTALIGLGEAVKGAGKGFEIVAYITISTGVNGVLVLNQKIAPNALGYEIGNQIVDLDKTYDPQSTDFEGLVAGSQFPRRFGKPAHEMTDPNVWNEMAHLVSYGVHNAILFWSPEVVILGGSVAKSIPLEALIKNIEERLTIFSTLPQIKKGELEDFGGLWGALHYAKSLA